LSNIIGFRRGNVCGLFSKKGGGAFLKMNQKSFNECLPYVLCGIVKNKIQYYYAKHPSCDIRRIIKYIQQQNKKLVPNVKTKHS